MGLAGLAVPLKSLKTSCSQCLCFWCMKWAKAVFVEGRDQCHET